MILRQFCARHGRTVLSRSSTATRSSYATSISDRTNTPTTGDRQPQQRIPGHPDDPSSILDTDTHAPTGQTRRLESAIEDAKTSTNALRLDVNAYIAARNGGVTSDASSLMSQQVAGLPSRQTALEAARLVENSLQGHKQYKSRVYEMKQSQDLGSKVLNRYNPDDVIDAPPRIEQIDLPTLLANQTHLGHHTSLWNPANSSYIFGIRDGIHIISLDITYAYLKRAAKVVQEVARRGGVILFIGTRKNQDDIVVKAAKRAGAYHIYTRWVPGTLSNGQQLLGRCAVKVVNVLDQELESYREAFSQGQHQVVRPDLVICLNPLENEVCLHECGIYGIPTIGVIDTDANPAWVTYPIPANDDSLRSIALITGVLSRAAQRGQALRKEAAVQGRATYSKQPAQAVLTALDNIMSLGDIQEGKNAGDKNNKDV